MQVMSATCEGYQAAAVPVHVDLTSMAEAADAQPTAESASSHQGVTHHPRLQELHKWVRRGCVWGVGQGMRLTLCASGAYGGAVRAAGSVCSCASFVGRVLRAVWAFGFIECVFLCMHKSACTQPVQGLKQCAELVCQRMCVAQCSGVLCPCVRTVEVDVSLV